MSSISVARQKPHTSHSRAKGFISCAHRYRLKYSAQVDEIPSMASVGGRVAHSLCEAWDKAGCPEWDYTQWMVEAEELLDAEIAATEHSSGKPISEWRISGRVSKEWPNKENRNWWSYKLPGFGESWMEWRKANPNFEIWVTPDGEQAIELELSVEVPGVDVPFLCYIDRVFVDTRTGALIILDLKFGSRNEEDLVQLARYAMALEIRYGVRAAFGAIYKGRAGELVPIFKDGNVLMPLAHLPTSVVAKSLAETHGLMKAGFYPPNPGMQCGWCDVRTACVWAQGKDAWKHDPLHPQYQDQVALAA